MSKLTFVCGGNTILPTIYRRLSSLTTFSSFSTSTDEEKRPSNLDSEDFRVLDLRSFGGKGGGRDEGRRRAGGVRAIDMRKKLVEERANKMPVDQDWTSVWPGPRTFHPSSVPLPIRMGMNTLGASPGKKGNAELMKIPNFLHLTPPAIKKHVRALMKFTSPWPEGLKEENFPLTFISSDYCHSSPSIRDPLARIVTLQVKLSDLELDERAKDKFLRLVGERYNEKTGIISIVADRCPTKKQNTDYALYLLTAVYHESWRVEDWEKEKSEDDMEVYIWEGSKCQGNALSALGESNPPTKESLEKYSKALLSVFNEDENVDTLAAYKKASTNLLFPSQNK